MTYRSKALIAAAIMLLSVVSAYAGIAFLKGEKVSGLNKICYYDYLGSEVAITIKAHELCPQTINVPD